MIKISAKYLSLETATLLKKANTICSGKKNTLILHNKEVKNVQRALKKQVKVLQTALNKLYPAMPSLSVTATRQGCVCLPFAKFALVPVLRVRDKLSCASKER